MSENENEIGIIRIESPNREGIDRALSLFGDKIDINCFHVYEERKPTTSVYGGVTGLWVAFCEFDTKAKE